MGGEPGVSAALCLPASAIFCAVCVCLPLSAAVWCFVMICHEVSQSWSLNCPVHYYHRVVGKNCEKFSSLFPKGSLEEAEHVSLWSRFWSSGVVTIDSMALL